MIRRARTPGPSPASIPSPRRGDRRLPALAAPRLLPLLAVALAACGEPAAAPAPARAATSLPPGPTGADRAGPAGAPTAWIPVRRPADAALQVLPAEVAGAAAAQGEVVPPAEAQVLAVAVQVGDAVEAGAVVAEVRVPSLVAALARLDSAGRRLRPVQARLQAVRALRQDGLAAADAVFALEAEVARLEAEQAEAQATLLAAGVGAADREGLRREGRLSLRAPVTGRVRRVEAPLGAQRGPGDPPLLSLVAEGPARVAVTSTRPLPQALGAVRFVGGDGRAVILEPTPLATVPAQDGPGLVHFFKASEPLAAGLRGEVHLSADPDAIWEVPRGALWATPAGAWVARRRGDGAEWVSVRVLTGAGTSAWVQGPLGAEDQVAADVRRLLAAGLAEPTAEPAPAAEPVPAAEAAP